MHARDLRKMIAPLLAALLAGCASNPAPKGWRPSAAEAQRATRGGWILIEREDDTNVTGELIAVDPATLHVLTVSGLQSVPRSAVRKARLVGYGTAEHLWIWTAVGALSTLSHGGQMVLTLPVWLIGGSVAVYVSEEHANEGTPASCHGRTREFHQPPDNARKIWVSNLLEDFVVPVALGEGNREVKRRKSRLYVERKESGAKMELASSTWYENDDLWVDSYSFAFPEVSFEAARAQVPKIIALSGCKGGVILDLCCGPGRHAVPFAERAFAVTGVDRTVFLLDKARAYAKVAEVEVEWVRQDMRRFVRHEAFDLAISMCTSFGYFDNPADNAAVLSNIFASLKDGGAFVLDGVGKEVLARRFEPTSSHELPDGGLIVQRRKVIDDWSRMDNQWILVKDDNALSLRFRHWIYSARELGGMLETAGFSKIRMYGDLDGAPYSPSAERLVALASKCAS